MMKSKTSRARTTNRPLALCLLCATLTAPAAAGRGPARQNPASPPQTAPPQQTPLRPPAPSAARTPAPTSPDDGDDVVRITANLVQFDVTVTDKQGRPVTGLKPEDFEVRVDGRPQAVTELSFVSADAGTMTTERAPTNAERKTRGGCGRARPSGLAQTSSPASISCK